MLRKIGLWLLAGFVIYMIAKRPEASADIARAIGGGLLAGYRGFGRFLVSL